MRTANLGTVSYSPGEPPSDPSDMRRFLSAELDRIAAAVRGLADGHLDKVHVSPAKPRDGDYRYADGTNWNPGSGIGLYAYISSAWDRILTSGRGLFVKEGANLRMGAAVLVGGTVTVNNTSVTANSRIFLTSQVDGGTPGFLRISARVAGTSFDITSSSGTDTSTVAYLIVEPA